MSNPPVEPVIRARIWSDNRIAGARLRVALIPDIGRVQISTAPHAVGLDTYGAPFFGEATLRDVIAYLTEVADELAFGGGGT